MLSYPLAYAVEYPANHKEAPIEWVLQVLP